MPYAKFFENVLKDARCEDLAIVRHYAVDPDLTALIFQNHAPQEIGCTHAILTRIAPDLAQSAAIVDGYEKDIVSHSFRIVACDHRESGGPYGEIGLIF